MGSELRNDTNWHLYFRWIILFVLQSMDWGEKELKFGALLEGCFSDSVEIMVAFSWVVGEG